MRLAALTSADGSRRSQSDPLRPVVKTAGNRSGGRNLGLRRLNRIDAFDFVETVEKT